MVEAKAVAVILVLAAASCKAAPLPPHFHPSYMTGDRVLVSGDEGRPVRGLVIRVLVYGGESRWYDYVVEVRDRFGGIRHAHFTGRELRPWPPEGEPAVLTGKKPA